MAPPPPSSGEGPAAAQEEKKQIVRRPAPLRMLTGIALAAVGLGLLWLVFGEGSPIDTTTTRHEGKAVIGGALLVVVGVALFCVSLVQRSCRRCRRPIDRGNKAVPFDAAHLDTLVAAHAAGDLTPITALVDDRHRVVHHQTQMATLEIAACDRCGEVGEVAIARRTGLHGGSHEVTGWREVHGPVVGWLHDRSAAVDQQ
jgi:uncharacterized membrane protein YidH (DUF202 family)